MQKHEVGPIIYNLTAYKLSIERADCPKLHDWFRAFEANTWLRKFLVSFPVKSWCLEFVIHQ